VLSAHTSRERPEMATPFVGALLNGINSVSIDLPNVARAISKSNAIVETGEPI
jgi:hypothetical protein